MKKILVMGTGGTIVAKSTHMGLSPDEDSGVMQKTLDAFRSYYDIDYKGIMNLDSSNIQPEEWQTIAAYVFESLKTYDGIVITHGTDTMAYTASALTFMLQNLNKPVVLTGSQLPLAHPVTDAVTNLSLALSAVDNEIPGVSIAFHHKVIKGCRAVKVRTMGFDAFESINYPYLAEFKLEGMRRQQCFDWPKGVSGGSPTLKSALSGEVFLLKLIPGSNPHIFDALVQQGYKGVVLEAFGLGGLHHLRRDLSEKIRRLIENGTSVIVRSQCLYEQSDFSLYEAGRKVLQSGAVQAWDMTTEACVTKLMWALGQTRDVCGVRDIFETNYADEITLSVQ
ncbi:MAG: asparaginase [Oscillospiraceae bacterium]|nr:asparaginase [Oscillospiraceae bacterium]